VIAATNDAAVNEAVARACRKHGILVNAATSPDEGTFVVPSVVERGDLLIAISTCGTARRWPGRSGRTWSGPMARVRCLLEKMANLRRRLLTEVAEEDVRRKVYQAVVDSDVLYLLKAGQTHEADMRIAEIVKAVAGGTATSPS